MVERELPRIVILATALSLVPLLAGLALVVWPGLLPLDPVILERTIIGYSALLLAFLGGVRWGIRIIGRRGTDLTYVLGSLGALLGLVTLLLPFSLAVAILTVGFAAQGAWDVWSGYRGTVPETYARRRASATLMAVLVLVAILVARAVLI
jgi:hypothetical protein